MTTKRKTTAEFIISAKSVHGNKYDYSKVNYKNDSTKIEIICTTHGAFWQSPNNHLRGQNCPDCANAARLEKSNQSFINKCKSIHGDKYDYSKVDYKNTLTKVEIICKTHGSFWQTPKTHYKLEGCKACANIKLRDIQQKRRSSRHEVIDRFIKAHGDKYDYSKVDYKGTHEKVEIICPDHGSFWQRANGHANGQGCSKCGVISRSFGAMVSQEEIIDRFIKAHGNKYDYSKVDYKGTHEKVEIICPVHGSFWQRANGHANGCGCSKCNTKKSKIESKLKDALESIGVNCVGGLRPFANKRYEADISILDDNGNIILLVEVNGLHWHSTAHKTIRYHKEKTDMANDVGIRLVHIWEDELLTQFDKVVAFIKNIVMPSKSVLYARKCKLIPVPNHVAKEFLIKQHIQNYVRSSFHIGIFHTDRLVGISSFTKRPDSTYELVRYATSLPVVGGLGKVTKYAHLKTDKPIKSFCDIAKHQGGSYLKAGYKLMSTLPPDYMYRVGQVRRHKFGFRRKHLARDYPEVYDEALSELEITKLAGLDRIYDCGKFKFVYTT